MVETMSALVVLCLITYGNARIAAILLLMEQTIDLAGLIDDQSLWCMTAAIMMAVQYHIIKQNTIYRLFCAAIMLLYYVALAYVLLGDDPSEGVNKIMSYVTYSQIALLIWWTMNERGVTRFILRPDPDKLCHNLRRGI